MTFKEFYISDRDGKSNCVVRSLCKILDKQYNNVYDDLLKIAEKLKCSSFNDVEVFETYMENNNILKMNYGKNIKIKDLKLYNGSYVILCYDKKEFYHMVSVINNVIFDKNTDCMNLYVLTIYKKKQ